MASSDPPSSRDREVLAGLPNARPTRRSAKRDRPARGQRAAGAAADPAKSGAKAAPKAKRAAPRSTAREAATAKAGAQRSTAKTDARRSTAKTSAPRSTAKTSAPRSTAKTSAPRSTGARRSAPKTQAIPPAGYATPDTDDDGPKGADLVTTVVQAAGELAQIGISAGGRALKSALERLPRP
jgi:hypothetical protein